jgi:hypothetical protein
MAKPDNASVVVTRLFLVTLVGAACGWCLVVAFAFASMNNVTPSGSPEWWAAALDKLFYSSSDSWAAWLLAALLLTCAGIGARDLTALLRHITCCTAVACGPAEPGAAADGPRL